VNVAPAFAPQPPSFQPQYHGPHTCSPHMQLQLAHSSNLTALSSQHQAHSSHIFPAPAISWYRVAYPGGVDLRSGPSLGASHVGVTLPKNEFFAVSEEIPSVDGRIYLQLSDGRGWAFDDSALMPYNPTVVKGKWVPTGPEPHMAAHSASFALPPMGIHEGPWDPMEGPDMPPEESEEIAVAHEVSEEETKVRRRKRGGVKRNKAKRRLAAEALAQQMKQDAEEADTDVPSSEEGGLPSSEGASSDMDSPQGTIMPIQVS